MFLRIGAGVSVNLLTGFMVQEFADGSFDLFAPTPFPGGNICITVPAEQHDAVTKTLNECGWRGKYISPPPDRPTEEEMQAIARKMAAGNHSRILVPPAGTNVSTIR